MQTQATPQLEIECLVMGDQHQLRGAVSGDEPGPYQYRLSLKKQGQSGQAQSSQSGALTLVADQSAYTGRILINVQVDDRYSVHLQLMNEEGVLIAEQWLIYP